VTADLKTFEAFGCFGAACITALTVQSTKGVERVEPVSAEIARETLDFLVGDLRISAIKTGMLGTGEMVAEVYKFVRKMRDLERKDVGKSPVVVVCDPVLRSSSGHALLDEVGVELLRTDLLPVVDWVTPNMDELAVLLKREKIERAAVPEAARALQKMAVVGRSEAGAKHPRLNVVVTGGHLERPDDYLLTAGGEERWFEGEKIAGEHGFHGTGCAFSSALAANLAKGLGPVDAVGSAKAYVAGAMRHARKMGQGDLVLEHYWSRD
jgi:hydroxymethylpyrimidine/phosphomethylpyrimidine kinase